jgi:dTDP-4-amino-4,6-dideoxygalactose transaminase
MSEIQAAIGVAQLKKLPLFLKRRRENAEVLTERLENLGKLALPGEGEGLRHSWYLYTVRLIGANAGKRNKLVGKLNAKNIEARVYYETPIHMLPLYRETLGYKRGALPEAEKAARQVFSLPVHPKVSLEDLNYIADTLRKMLS